MQREVIFFFVFTGGFSELRINEGAKVYLQETVVNRKYYEWQLSVGHQWLKIENDHVIETHYCHPGAKGISINTCHGKVFIDFDRLQTNDPGMKVRRLSFLPQGQTEDIGWYFRDGQVWREYGSQGLSMLSPSVSSREVERQFTLNPQGTFAFSGYMIDFSNMTESHAFTGSYRRVRRRPKFTSNTGVVGSTSALPTAASSQTYRWELTGDCPNWTEHQARICLFDSSGIERQYQLNQRGTLHFKMNRSSYTLGFSVTQINLSTGTTRAVRRLNQ
ncbi:pre-rRNA-processing protein TSR1 [Sarotherodon galilaeus]